jgi:hypothetical protein
MFKNKSSVFSSLIFFIVVAVANYISLHLVLQTFDKAKVEQVLKEFK